MERRKNSHKNPCAGKRVTKMSKPKTFTELTNELAKKQARNQKRREQRKAKKK